MSEKEVPLVAFRLSADEYREAKRIAEMASSHGTLKNDSVNTFAKACLFVRINEWKQIEYQQAAQQAVEQEKIDRLREHGIPPEGYERVG